MTARASAPFSTRGSGRLAGTRRGRSGRCCGPRQVVGWELWREVRTGSGTGVRPRVSAVLLSNDVPVLKN